MPTFADVRALQAIGYYDEEGLPRSNASSANGTSVETPTIDPYGTCAAAGSSGLGTTGATCVKLVVDLMGVYAGRLMFFDGPPSVSPVHVADASGQGDVTSAAAVRLKFQQLQMQWQRAGAAAASVTGIANVIYMQLDAEQFVQEVLATPLPPIDNSWKLKDYVMACSGGAVALMVGIWVTWQICRPYRACMKERRRLARKFAPSEKDPGGILRHDIMYTRQDDQIKTVMVDAREEARLVGSPVLPRPQSSLGNSVRPGSTGSQSDGDGLMLTMTTPHPLVGNPFMEMDWEREKRLEAAQKDALFASLPRTPSVSRTKSGNKNEGGKESPRVAPLDESVRSRRDVSPRTSREALVIDVPNVPGATASGPLSPAQSGGTLAIKSGRGNAAATPKQSESPAGSVRFAASPVVLTPSAVITKAVPDPDFTAVQTGNTEGLEGEEKALALLAQVSRKPRPEPLNDQVRRALRLNQKVRAGLMSPSDADGKLHRSPG